MVKRKDVGFCTSLLIQQSGSRITYAYRQAYQSAHVIRYYNFAYLRPFGRRTGKDTIYPNMDVLIIASSYAYSNLRDLIVEDNASKRPFPFKYILCSHYGCLSVYKGKNIFLIIQVFYLIFTIA